MKRFVYAIAFDLQSINRKVTHCPEINKLRSKSGVY